MLKMLLLVFLVLVILLVFGAGTIIYWIVSQLKRAAVAGRSRQKMPQMEKKSIPSQPSRSQIEEAEFQEVE